MEVFSLSMVFFRLTRGNKGTQTVALGPFESMLILVSVQCPPHVREQGEKKKAQCIKERVGHQIMKYANTGGTDHTTKWLSLVRSNEYCSFLPREFVWSRKR